MNESSGTKTGNTGSEDTDQALEDRKVDATSKDTVADVKDEKKVADSESEQTGVGTSVPSPDGTIDESDETKDAGPM